jgi:uncharacterized protein YdiU (UPF0061 family)
MGIMQELRAESTSGAQVSEASEGQGLGGEPVRPGSVRDFFKEVVRRNAEMVAGWQVYGFCHGVINTDK